MPLVDSYTAIIIEPIAAIKLLIKILHYSILELIKVDTTYLRTVILTASLFTPLVYVAIITVIITCLCWIT